ncbi:hypothetical protein IDH44_00400 [Paenibacillus sp. IB182496]|uniref:YiiM-like triple helical domain-containing protein n=1 Tax=Paenibacillus sabuli TaxID=2772509 RepID=A0A927GPS7_9BACL|nr:3-alpha domain-containing protein [Paenibacillus sabuli]MBD2843633.1 hypothetical protein [Paenibacillus sabuli]
MPQCRIDRAAVLQAGTVADTDELVLLERDAAGVTVADANRIMHHETDYLEGMSRLLAVEALSASWSATLRKRLDGQRTDTKARLEGQA